MARCTPAPPGWAGCGAGGLWDGAALAPSPAGLDAAGTSLHLEVWVASKVRQGQLSPS